MPPLATSGPRESTKRPRSIPANVRSAIMCMVWGRLDDPDALPLPMIDACVVAGIKPYVLRRYLDRPGVIAFLRAERRKYRESVCASNEGALKKVRDGSKNGMCVVAACRQLDAMQADESGRAGNAVSPGVTVRIVNVIQQNADVGKTIDVTPPRRAVPLPADDEPIFHKP
jgi:hypothetical protein